MWLIIAAFITLTVIIGIGLYTEFYVNKNDNIYVHLPTHPQTKRGISPITIPPNVYRNSPIMYRSRIQDSPVDFA
jgi:hypothetical protein